MHDSTISMVPTTRVYRSLHDFVDGHLRFLLRGSFRKGLPGSGFAVQAWSAGCKELGIQESYRCLVRKKGI